MNNYFLGLSLSFFILVIAAIFDFKELGGVSCIAFITFLVLIVRKKKKDKAIQLENERKRLENDQKIRQANLLAERKTKIELTKQAIRDEISAIPNVKINLGEPRTLKRNTLSEMPEIKFSPIGKSFNIEAKLPSFVVVDVETTGINCSSNRICQLSAIRYEEFKPTLKFDTYINPHLKILPETTAVNGITNAMVESSPTISQIYESFIEFVGNSPVIGYNLSFDLKFLFTSGIDLISKRKLYDVYELSKKAYKDYGFGNFKLERIAELNDIYYDAHNSLYDCYATAKVFHKAIYEIIE